MVEGRTTPVVIRLNIPLTLGHDRISVKDASVISALSGLMISGSMENLARPQTSAHIVGHVSLMDLNKLANLSLPAPSRSVASDVQLDADASVSQDEIKVAKMHIALGASSADATGTLRNPHGSGSLDFRSNLDLAQLASLTGSPRRLSGIIALSGKAGFDGNVLKVDPFRLSAFGGEMQGTAMLEQFARYQISARLSAIDLQSIQRRLGMKPLPYSASVAGTVNARGDVKSSASQIADVNSALTISPGSAGIPLSGHVTANYSGGRGELRVGESSLQLPHSAVKFSGSMRDGLRLEVTSQDLRDLLAAVPDSAATSAAKLNGGQAELQAVISGTFRDPKVRGHLAVTRIVIQDRQFDSLATDLKASTTQLDVSNGSVSRGMMRARLEGSAGLADWSPEPNSPVSVMATLENGDVADLLALAGQPSSGYSGALSAEVRVAGTIGNPTGSANLQASKGTLAGEPFDQLQAQVALSDQRVSLPSAFLTRDMARVNLSAEYTHPSQSFTAGHLTARVNSDGVDLGQMRSLQSNHPNSSGTVQINAAVEGDLKSTGDQTAFQVTSLAGDLSAQKLYFQGDDYGDLTVRATTSSNTVTYNLVSNFAGSQVRADGQTQLMADYPTTLNANLNNLPIERVLAVAKHTDIPATGMLAGSVHLSGTAANPQGNVDLNLTNAVLYGEPVDRLVAHVEYLPESIHVTQIEATARQSRVSLSASFDHPVSDLQQGDVQFHVQSDRVDLARIRSVQNRRPGLAGALNISADGKIALHPPAGNADAVASRITIQDLKANLAAKGLAAQGKNLGDLEMAATTSGGRVNVTFDSNLANAKIQGHGSTQLSGDYQTNAELSFDGLTWSNLQPLVGSDLSSFDGISSGRITVDGPARQVDQLSAALRVTRLEIRSSRGLLTGGKTVVLQNQGDIALTLNKGQMRVESARLTGPQTDITASGTASIPGRSLNLKLDANANLALLQTTIPDVFSSGRVTLGANIRGTMHDPQVDGRVELHSASLSYADLPAGLSNANGVVVFNGKTATIQSLSGESGGGKINLSGFATLDNGIRFALRAQGSGVRIRVQQGVSVVVNANLTLSGTSEKSLTSGTVRIDRLTYQPQTDVGSLLSRAGPPVESPTSPTPLLANMGLDILVRTSSATSVQASITDNLQIITDLRIRGTAAQPGVVGSIQASQGELAFFGSKYKISSGTVSFFNPNRVEPILNLSLETAAKGVTVVLTITGPIDNMKLSYTSDPPLQFDEIVSLLAAGKAPTSDPTLLANQPAEPPQSFQQMGESALVGKALADPVSSRLQRVFGVSQLKIDPSFTSGSQLPQARVTLQQQVASNLVFTYIAALDNPNADVIRIEWTVNPQWSAAANRDENGLFSINLQYKKEFR